jgi:hypothetical protein
MIRVSIEAAQCDLTYLIDIAGEGEVVILERDGVPICALVSLENLEIPEKPPDEEGIDES